MLETLCSLMKKYMELTNDIESTNAKLEIAIYENGIKDIEHAVTNETILDLMLSKIHRTIERAKIEQEIAKAMKKLGV